MMPRRGRGRRSQPAAFNRRGLPARLQESPFLRAMGEAVSEEPLAMVVSSAGSLEPGMKEEKPCQSSGHDLFSYLKEEEEAEVGPALLGTFVPVPTASVPRRVKQHSHSEVHEMLSYLKKEEEEEEEVAEIACLPSPHVLPAPAALPSLPAYASPATMGRSFLPGGRETLHFFTPMAHIPASAHSKRGRDREAFTGDGAPPPVHKKTTSAVWDYFTLDPREACVAVCSTCQKRVRRGKDGGTRPGTTALHKHLKVHHGLHLPGVAVVPPSPLIPLKERPHSTPTVAVEPATPAFPFARQERNQPYYPPTHPTATQLASDTAWMLVVDMQPFSYVENEGFRRLMATAQPRWRIPSRAFFAKAMPQLSKVVSQAVRQAVACSVGRTVHITMDTWGGRQMATYVSVTGHWVAESGGALARQHATLSVCAFEGCCSPEDVCHQLREVLQDWLCDLKTGGVVSDSGAHTARAVRELRLRYIPCLARCLKLVTRAFLAMDAQVARLLKTSRRICSCYRRSATVRRRLSEVQATRGLRQPVGPDPLARSNSTLVMLECLYRQRQAVSAMLDEDEDGPHVLLAPADWKAMKCLVEILKPFEDATALVIRPDATLCQALPLLWFLEEQLRALRTRYYQENNNTAARLTTQALDSLEADHQLRDIKGNLMYRTAAFLDPRFRDITTMKLGGTDLSGAALLKEHIVGLAARSYVPPGSEMEFPPVGPSSQDQSSSPTSSRGSAAWQFTMKRWRAITRSDPASGLPSEGGAAAALREMEEYLHDNVDHVGENADPMLYWQGKMGAWPALFKVAVFHFGCPPTSSCSEDLPGAPSPAGARDQPRNLSPANVKMFTFIRRNRHLIAQDWRLLLGDLSSQSPVGAREDLNVEEEDDLLRLDEEHEDK